MDQNPYKSPEINPPETKPRWRALRVAGGVIALLGVVLFATLAIRGVLIGLRILPANQPDPGNHVAWSMVFAALAIGLYHLARLLFAEDPF